MFMVLDVFADADGLCRKQQKLAEAGLGVDYTALPALCNVLEPSCMPGNIHAVSYTHLTLPTNREV